MELIKKAETKLADVFKGAPKMSDANKETLVKIWPWLALIGGVLQALVAINALRWARTANDVNDLYRSIGVEVNVANRLSLWIWLTMIVLIVEAVMLLMAYPKLKRREKAGWDLLFMVGLLNVLYAIISLFSDYYGGFGALLWNLVVATFMFWLLFASRDKYKTAKK